MKINVKRACSSLIKIRESTKRFEILKLREFGKEHCKHFNSGYCFEEEQLCDKLYMELEIEDKSYFNEFLYYYIKGY